MLASARTLSRAGRVAAVAHAHMGRPVLSAAAVLASSAVCAAVPSPSLALSSRSLHTLSPLLREQFSKDKAKNKAKKEKTLEQKKKTGAMKDKAANVEAGEGVGVSVPAMEEEMNEYIERMRAAFAQIKAGRAVPTQLDDVICSAHGQMVPLKAIGTVSARNAQVLVIQLYDPSLYKEVDKAVRLHNPTLNPQQEEGACVVTFPKMTKELRESLVKQVSKKADETRNHLRTIRQSYLQQLKGLQGSGEISDDLVKDLKNQIQTSHDVLVAQIKKLQDEKDAEIRQV